MSTRINIVFLIVPNINEFILQIINFVCLMIWYLQ